MYEEFFFKVTLVGSHNTGKTTLVRRICEPSSSAQLGSTVPTVGVEFSSRVLKNVRPKTLVRLQLWDTAGAEKYAAVSAPVYRNSGGIIAVCDVTNRESLTDLTTRWLPIVFEHLPTLPTNCVLVVCNKLDLDTAAFTTADAAEVLENAGFKGALVMEGSALTGTNIEDAIALMANRIMDKFISAGTAKLAADAASKAAPKVPVAAKDPTPPPTSTQEPPEDNEADRSSHNASLTSPAAAASTVGPSSPLGNKADLSASTSSAKPKDKKKSCPC